MSSSSVVVVESAEMCEKWCCFFLASRSLSMGAVEAMAGDDVGLMGGVMECAVVEEVMVEVVSLVGSM